MNRKIPGLLGICGLLLAGCQDNDFREPPPPDEGLEPAEQTPPGEGQSDELAELQEEMRAIEEETRESLLPEQQEVEVPEGVPVPTDYVLVSDNQVGPMRITTLEVSGNLEALVAEFNAELEGLEEEVEPLEREEEEDGKYQARGRVMLENTRVTITVAESDQTIQEESTGTVTYQVTVLE